MHDEDCERVMDFVRNVEGFENKKIKEIFCESESKIRHITSSDEIKVYFWTFKAGNAKNGLDFKLP